MWLYDISYIHREIAKRLMTTENVIIAGIVIFDECIYVCALIFDFIKSYVHIMYMMEYFARLFSIIAATVAFTHNFHLLLRCSDLQSHERLN